MTRHGGLNDQLLARNSSSSVAPADSPADLGVGLGSRAYQVLSLLAVAAYLGVWLWHFPWVYGWHADDWACYVKGLDTIADAKSAFLVRANVLQPYFFLFSYLPLSSGIALPSHEIPIYGELTGNFRFFLMWTTLYHGVVAVAWAWFAAKLCANRLVALLSLVLLLTSQEFVLWTPQPDTRFVGLPMALAGVWLAARFLANPEGIPTSRCAGALFLAGTLLWVSQSLHYTSIHFIVPMMVTVVAWAGWTRWRDPRLWISYAALVSGCLWLHGSLELVSRYYVGLPWNAGPTASLLALNASNASPLGLAKNLAMWWEASSVLLGFPLLGAAAAGAWLHWRGIERLDSRHFIRPGIVVTAILLGLALILLAPSLPYPRKTAFLQPFLFLFAALFVVRAASRVFRRWPDRALAAVVLLALVAVIPLRRSGEVFRAHLGFGKVIHWAEANRGDRELRWMVTRRPYLYTPDDLCHDSPDNWVLTYFPLESLQVWPSLAESLWRAKPVYSQPTLWATESVHAVHCAWTRADLRGESLINEARVYRAGNLAATRGPVCQHE